MATFVAIGLGRGYASYAILILWLAIEGLLMLRTRGISFGQKIKKILKHPSFYMLVIGIVWGAGLLSYNILVEARKTKYPDPGNQHSAQRRAAVVAATKRSIKNMRILSTGGIS